MLKPLRMCCFCRQKKPQEELLRFTKQNNEIVLNEGKQTVFGRSAYICKDKLCIENSIKKKSLNRAFKKDVGSKIYEELTKFL